MKNPVTANAIRRKTFAAWLLLSVWLGGTAFVLHQHMLTLPPEGACVTPPDKR